MNNIGIRADALDEESFECFANDLCSGIFGKEIHGFSRGRDGGIDGTDDIKNPSIIIQAKRWTLYKTTAYKAICSEIEKIEKTIDDMQWKEPIRYVVVTSAGLSPSVQADLRKDYGNLLWDDNCLLDAAKINQYASDPSLQGIYRKYKLIDSNLAVFLRKDRMNSLPSDYLDFDPRYFVETDFFDKAFNIVMNKHILVIHGNPGVGKTTLCKMLGHVFANRCISKSDKSERATVVWRSPDEMSGIVRDYDANFRNSDNVVSDKLFFVVIDDFLGSNSLTTDSSQMQNLNRLLNRVRTYQNLFIVLNSRTQILETAKDEFQDFFANLQRGYNSVIDMLDMSDYTRIDKAKLLRMNLEREFSYSTSQEQKTFVTNYEYLREPYSIAENKRLINQKVYNKIIDHRNFNPRLIEYISQEFKKIKYNNPIGLLKFLQQTLDYPARIYDPLFNKMSADEKWILRCLYTFNEQTIPVNELIAAIEPFVSRTFDPMAALRKLEHSWIRFEKENLGESRVGFLNPGIRDYFTLKDKTTNFSKEIMEKAIFISQLENYLDRGAFNNLLLNRWSDFRDKYEYLGEYAVATFLTGCTYEQANKVIQELLIRYEGAWHFGESNGWVEVFSALQNGNLEVREREILKNQLFESIVNKKSNNKHFSDVLNTVTSVDSFDSIIDFFLPQIKRVYNIDIENRPFASIHKNNKAYNLISEICDKKQQLIQSSIDEYSVDYYDDVLNMVEAGQDDESISDEIFGDILSDCWGDSLAIYEEIDTFDSDAIYDLINQARSEIGFEYEEAQKQGNFENVSEEKHNYRPVIYSSEEKSEIDKIMDRPIG